MFDFIGCIRYLEMVTPFVLKNLKSISGTSIGAFISALLSVGYTSDDMLGGIGNNLYNDVLSKVKDNASILNILNDGFGIIKSDFVYEFIKKLLERKTKNGSITFEELYASTNIDLTITGTSLSNGITYFNFKNTPSMEIARAVKISLSLPFLFTCEKIENESFIDGFLDNFPIPKNCSNDELVIGFKIAHEYDTNDIKNMEDFILSFTRCITKGLEKEVMHACSEIIVINIPTKVPFVDFNIDYDSLKFLSSIGFNEVRKYMKGKSKNDLIYKKVCHTIVRRNSI